MKRLKDILDQYTDKQILDRLLKIYPDQKKNMGGYKKVVAELRRLKPVWSDYTLCVSKWSVSGTLDDEDTSFAMEFTDWAEWLTMKIKTTYSYLNALCFCLWEMTFMGFKQRKIKRKINRLRKMAKEIDKSLEKKGVISFV